MPDPTQAERTAPCARRQDFRRARSGFFSKHNLATYEVLGRTLTTSVSRGMTEEQAFIRAVEEGGGRVFRKFYAEFGKYEIAAIVFGDSALVKNDPDFIEKQDFSSFGKDAGRIKRMACEEAKRSEGGIHFFVDGSGIPVLVNKKGKLFFLSPDEMRAGGGKRIKAEVVPTNFDPQSAKEFKEVSDALRNGDSAMLERLRKASGAHSASRKESIEPLSTYTILDAVTGEEIGAAAANAKLGKSITIVSDRLFVPEITLINQFSASSQQPPTDANAHKPSWEWIFLFCGNAKENEELRPTVYTVCNFGQQAPESRAPGSGAASGQAGAFDAPMKNAAEPTAQPGIPQTDSAPAGLQFQAAKTLKGLRPVPSHAALFDGFAPAAKAAQKIEQAPCQSRQWQPALMNETIRELPANSPKSRKRRPRRRKPKPAPHMPWQRAMVKEKGGRAGIPSSEPRVKKRPRKNRKEKKESLRTMAPAARAKEGRKGGKRSGTGYGHDKPRPKVAPARMPSRPKAKPARMPRKPSMHAAQRTSDKRTRQPPATRKKSEVRCERPGLKAGRNRAHKVENGITNQAAGSKPKEERPEKRNKKAETTNRLLPIFTSRRARARSSSGRRAASGS